MVRRLMLFPFTGSFAIFGPLVNETTTKYTKLFVVYFNIPWFFGDNQLDIWPQPVENSESFRKYHVIKAMGYHGNARQNLDGARFTITNDKKASYQPDAGVVEEPNVDQADLPPKTESEQESNKDEEPGDDGQSNEQPEQPNGQPNESEQPEEQPEQPNGQPNESEQSNEQPEQPNGQPNESEQPEEQPE